VREIVTGTPCSRAAARRKYFRPARSTSSSCPRIARAFGPCSASAAVASETSSILHLEAARVFLEPAQVRIGRRHAKRSLVEACDGAVVEHLARAVAPWRVQHLADRGAHDIARDYAIQQPGGVPAAHHVLVERRDIEQRRGHPDRVVLALVRELVRARDDVADQRRQAWLAQSGAMRGWNGVVFSIQP
jgi:hypothetical protein